MRRQICWSLFRRSMAERSEKILKGWQDVQKNGDDELHHFIVALLNTDNEHAVRNFEMEVILGGKDAKTYLRQHMVTVSYVEIELGDEIMNKPTKLMSDPNRGGYQGLDASGSGETGCFCPNLERPATVLEMIEQFRELRPYRK